MNPPCLGGLATALSFAAACPAATISQTFEAGEDTSNWGSSWSNGSTVPTFLSTTLGGQSAGGGASLTQSFSRSFKNNTAGLDLATAYTLSMYVQLDTFDGPAGGLFEIVDGDFGSGNAANLRISTEETSPGIFAYHWQARANNSGWLDLGITMDLASPYHVELAVDPVTFTYSAVVQAIDPDGNVLGSGSLNNLAFDPNVINNHQNGTLLLYIQASSGGTDARIDNINIQSVPEPSAVLMASAAAATLAFARRRRAA
ncbi:PEP-CTERM domain protein [Haloferula sp. BvORR071]|uniref:PEP-CTERM domain protein n=1 Tax=Haloferula sp. BvORR071 TaxID=1396141 RepID=UPI000554E976|nr:PEP-CTERM domain protein [Haloferula sp. BvORR071]